MYYEFLKELYGRLDAELLIWVQLITDTERWEFKMNWYDWWVINKDI